MRRFVQLAVAVATMLPAAAYAATPTTISSTIPVIVSVYLPLQTKFKRPLEFGNIMQGSVVALDATSRRTGDPSDFIPTNGGQAGAFEITGSPGAKYTIALTTSQPEVGSPLYTVQAATNNGNGGATSGQLNSGGGDVIIIYGTADATNARPGTYLGATATVTLNYM